MPTVNSGEPAQAQSLHSQSARWQVAQVIAYHPVSAASP